VVLVRKGQITLFIILGIIILVIIGLIIYFARTEAEKKIEVARPTIAKVPQEIQPVYDYVQQCIYSLGKEAIKKAGERGGLITTKFHYNEYEPTEGRAVAYTPDLIIPYWWLMTSPNKCKKCEFITQKPELSDIEEEITNYVMLNIDKCNLKPFEKQGFIIKKVSEPMLKTTITDENTFITGKYHLRISKGQRTTDIEDFYIPFDVNIKEAYKLATELTELEAKGQYLEYLTKDLLDSFGGVDKNKIPPLYGFKMSMGRPVYWVKQNVAEKVQNILSSYIPLLKANGVANFDFIFGPEEVKHKDVYELLYNREFFIPLEGSYPDYSLNFLYYQWWKPYFDLNCNGQLCTADVVNNKLMFMLGLQEYSFAYDISYPVLVQLIDKKALKGDGFVFQFFLEANIRNNEPLQGQKIISLPEMPEPSTFCNPDQYQSGELTINIKDQLTAKPVDKAIISYTCLKDTCSIGETTKGVLKTRMPKCIGGIITISKQGYRTYSNILDTDFDENLSINIQLVPETKIKLKAKKYEFMKTGKFAPWKLEPSLGAETPEKDENVLVTFKKINLKPFEEPFSAIALLEGSEAKEINLVPGDYEIKITSMLRPKEPLVIPKDRRCKDIPSLNPFEGFSNEQCYTVPEENITFDFKHPLPYGGAEVKTTITPQKLANKEYIEVKYFTFALDKIPEKQRIVEDMSEFGKIGMYSKSMKNKLQPVLT